MWLDWLIEIGLAIWRITWQPLLYALVFFTIWTGYRRIKRDRKQFGHRIFEMGSEWKGTWLTGVLFGLVLSVGLILAGGILSYEVMLLISAVVFLALLTHQVRFLSPVYTLGIATLFIWSVQAFDFYLGFDRLTAAVQAVDLRIMLLMLIVLFIAEMIMIGTTKRAWTFPGLEKSDRGKHVGFHIARRLMFIPLILPIYGSALESVTWIPWWPVFQTETTTFSLMAFPFVIGYAQRYHASFSDVGSKRLAKHLSILFVLLLAIGSSLYWFPEFLPVFIAVTIVGRAIVQWLTYIKEKGKRSRFSPRPDGIIVLGIVPESPADEMGLIIGEKIIRVHDQPVRNEHEFYAIMRQNRTYCKLTVENLDGERRFLQRSLYDNESHALGIVFVKDTPRFSTEAVETEDIDLSEVLSTAYEAEKRAESIRRSSGLSERSLRPVEKTEVARVSSDEKIDKSEAERISSDDSTALLDETEEADRLEEPSDQEFKRLEDGGGEHLLLEDSDQAEQISIEGPTDQEDLKSLEDPSNRSFYRERSRPRFASVQFEKKSDKENEDTDETNDEQPKPAENDELFNLINEINEKDNSETKR